MTAALRRIYFNVLAVCGATLFNSGFSHAQTTPGLGRYERLPGEYVVLKAATPLDSPVLLTESFSFELPDFKITLEKGEIQKIAGLDSAGSGFVFQGRGRVKFAPRHKVEREQLKRFTRQDTLEMTFESCVFRSLSDSLWRKLIFEKKNTKTERLNRVLDFAQEAQKALLDKAGYNLPARLLSENYLGLEEFTAFYFRKASELGGSSPWYYYFFDPAGSESVQFYQFAKRQIGSPFYTLCRYPLGDYSAPNPESDFRITRYNGWMTIRKNGRVEADLGVDIYSGFREIKAVYFQLSPHATVERVTTIYGDSLFYIQEKNQQGLVVFSPDSTAQVDTLRLNFHYAGDLMEPSRAGNLYLKETTHWHPRLGNLRRARYKIVYKYPQNRRLVTQGELLREWTEHNEKLSYYIQRTPVKAVIFSLGRFKSSTNYGLDSLQIEVFGERSSSGSAFERIASNMAQSATFLSKKIHPYFRDYLRVVETPGTESQSFPGYIKLSQLGFQQARAGVLEELRNHEMAHQWWGNDVGWRGYRDQWLSEAFAEYMAALIIKDAMKRPDIFKKIVKSWRDDLLRGGNVGVSLGMQRFGFSKAALTNSERMKAGPIALGYRLGQKAPIDYYLNVYEKGAYVLHMLRFIFSNDSSGSDEKFWQVLRAYREKYHDKNPATRDFVEIANQFADEDLTPFFEFWLLNNQIPAYVYHWQIERKQDGFWIVGEIRQTNTSAQLAMPVPLKVRFKNKVDLSGRIWVSDSPEQLKLGPFEQRPRSVVVNPDHTILGRFRRE